MSTLTEIEAAFDRLSHPEQEILLEHLARKLGMRLPVTDGSRRTQRERWLQTPVLPVDPPFRGRSLKEILDDIRAEEEY
jgi:hypothetical protein